MSTEIPVNSGNPDLVDCASAAFRKNYQLDGKRPYLFFAPEMYVDFALQIPDENGFDNSGHDIIFNLHPMGQYSFEMYHSDGFWKIGDNGPNRSQALGKEIVQWLTIRLIQKLLKLFP